MAEFRTVARPREGGFRVMDKDGRFVSDVMLTRKDAIEFERSLEERLRKEQATKEMYPSAEKK